MGARIYEKPFEVLVCRADDPVIGTVVEPAGKDEWNVAVTVKDLRVCGVIDGMLEFTFRKGEALQERSVRARYSCTIDGPLQCRPQSILFGGLQAGESSEEVVWVTSAPGGGGGRVVIDRAAASDDECLSVTSGNGEQDAWVRVRFAAKERPGMRSGILRVFVRQGDTYEMRVPYLAHVLAPKQCAN